MTQAKFNIETTFLSYVNIPTVIDILPCVLFVLILTSQGGTGTTLDHIK